MPVGKTYNLVENRQGITHATVSFLCNNVQSLRFCFNMFFSGYIFQVFYRVVHTDTIEIVYLASTQNSRKNFMLFGCGKNKYSMMRRFFQCLQKGIESCLRKHVYLVDDIYFIFSNLWRDAYLFDQRAYVFYRVIGCGIQLMNVIRTLFVESTA